MQMSTVNTEKQVKATESASSLTSNKFKSVNVYSLMYLVIPKGLMFIN